MCYLVKYQRNNLQDCLKCVLLWYISEEQLAGLPKMCVTLLHIQGRTCVTAPTVSYFVTDWRRCLQDCLKCVLLCYISQQQLSGLPQMCITLLHIKATICRIAPNVCYSVTDGRSNLQDCLKCVLLCYISKQQLAELPQMCVILLHIKAITCRIASNVLLCYRSKKQLARLPQSLKSLALSTSSS